LLLLTLVFAFGSVASGAGPSLEITKEVLGGSDETPTGEVFTYPMRYRGASTTTNFYNVVLTDILPSEFEFISVDGSVRTDSIHYDSATRTVTMEFVNPLLAGSTGEIDLNVRFPAGTTLPGTTADNTATLSASNADTVTSRTVRVTALADSQAFASKQVIGGSIPLDQNVTYEVSVRNQSNAGALNLTNIVVIDTLPPNSVFVSASGGGVYDPNNHLVTWNLPDLDAGGSGRITRTVTVLFPSSDFEVGQTVSNTLEITGTPYGQVETNLNDSATNVIEVAELDLFFRKRVDSNYVYEGKPISKTYQFDLENRGNVEVDDIVITDVIPPQIEITDIWSGRPDGTPSGYGDPIAVHYKTTLNTNWTALPGSPFSNGSVRVEVSSLGLAALETIQELRWDLGSLPVLYELKDLKYKADLLTTIDRNGDPVEAGDMIDNTVLITYTDFEGSKTGASSGNIQVKTPRPVARLEKSLVGSSTVNHGDLVTFKLKLENRSVGAQPLIDPSIGDLLAGFLEYQPGSWQMANAPAGAPLPQFTRIDDYNGSGQTLLRWEWAGASAYELPVNESIEILFQALIQTGTVYGSKANRAVLFNWANTNVDSNATGSGQDTEDIDGDGDTTEQVFYKDFSFRINSDAAMESVKWVRGELDADWHKYPDDGYTVPGGQADYRVIVRNVGNVPMEDVVVLDILPYIGDTGVIDLSARNTEWRPNLVGPVAVPPGVKVFYSAEADPLRTEFVGSGPAGARPPYWTETPPANITEVRSLRFEFESVVIDPGEEFELAWPMRAPVGAPTDGEIAWNSFGFYGVREDTGDALLASEPFKVGIAVQPDTNAVYGNRLWYDANTNGLQDAGEPGINGVRVTLYEDDGPLGVGDGIINTNEDRMVAWTFTGDDFFGDPGYYLFPNLDRGNYYAVFDIPDGYSVSPRNAGDDALDSDIDPVSWTTAITYLEESEKDLTWDAGLYHPPVGVELVKTAGTAADGDTYWINDGDSVIYYYEITNTGTLPLVRFILSDDRLGEVARFDGPLAPGASTTLTATASSVGDGVVNIGSVEARPAWPGSGEIPGAPKVTDDDDALVRHYASIGDFVWEDKDADGHQDGNENGISGVTVRLYDAAGSNIATTVTGGNGRYRFRDLLPGDYNVSFDQPAGYLPSPRNASSGGADSDADPATGAAIQTTLVSGENDLTWDAGFYRLAAIGDKTWYDLDADGRQDGGEPALSNITVRLYNDGGAEIASTTTDANGNYLFDDLTPGRYSVGFDLPPDFYRSPKDTSPNGVDSDADPATGRTVETMLISNETDLSWDAGYYKLATLGDRVWYDVDADGEQDPGETGLRNVTVRLYDAGGSEVASTTTDSNGDYLFENLVPGNYSVGFDAPAGYDFSPKDAAADGVDSDADPATGRTANTLLLSEEDDRTWDAGLYKVASLGDRVWYDADADGEQDAGEAGMAGVTVRLYDAGGTEVATTTTDGSGNYLFDDLVPGEYSVGFDAPAGHVPSPRDNAADGVDSDADPATGRTVPTVLVSDEYDPTWDAGFYEYASIGDYVWEDMNADGVQDGGEPGIPGVTVRLYNASGAEIASTTTDANGAYRFDGLEPGEYSLGFDAPAGFNPSPMDEGADDAADSDADETTGRTISTVLVGGEYDATWDAGFYRYAAIGNYVWNDENRDGRQDPSEPAVSNVTVRLYDGASNLVATTSTDADGAYLFDGLVPGTYRVEVEVPARYDVTLQDQGDDAGDSDIDLDGRMIETVLVSGEEDLTWDAGFYFTIADLELTKEGALSDYDAKWMMLISKGQQFVDGDYWLRMEKDIPSFDVWGPGNMRGNIRMDSGWHHIVGRFIRGTNTWGPHTMQILVDGVLVGTRVASGTTDTSDAALLLGSYMENAGFFGGAMDEVRLSGIARGDAWLLAGVRQIEDPASYITFGPETAGGVYSAQRPVTVSSSITAEDLTDFPLLVSIAEDNLKSVDMGGLVQSEDGYDIAFTLTDGTVLDAEFERYDPDTGALTAWVRMPTLSSSADADLLLKYGKAGETDFAGNPEGVWDAHTRLVYHFNDADGAPIDDATANGNDGAATDPFRVAQGRVAGAYVFDGIDDLVKTPDSTSLRFDNTDFTIEGWYSRRAVQADAWFKVTIENKGPDTVRQSEVTDVMTGLSYVGHDLTQGSFDPATGVWSVGDLEVGDTEVLWISADLTATGTPRNVAEVTVGPHIDPDSTPDNGDPSEDDIGIVTLGETVDPGKPDFDITGLTIDPANLDTGEVFSVDVTVVNHGPAAGDAGDLQILVDAHAGGAADASEAVGALGSGESKTVTISGLTAPTNGGWYLLRATVDALDATDESSEGNNVYSKSYQVEGGLPAWMKPDFIVTAVSMSPSSLRPGETFEVDVTVRNKGDIPGDAGDLGIIIDAAAGGVDASTDIGALDVNESRTFTLGGLRAPAAGWYNLKAVADVNGETDEKSEGNNHKLDTYGVSVIRIRSQHTAAGFQLHWASRIGETYRLFRSTNLVHGFSVLATNLPATPPENAYLDTTAPDTGFVGYRVELEP